MACVPWPRLKGSEQSDVDAVLLAPAWWAKSRRVRRAGEKVCRVGGHAVGSETLALSHAVMLYNIAAQYIRRENVKK